MQLSDFLVLIWERKHIRFPKQSLLIHE